VYDDETGIIYVNDGLTDPDQLAIVIAHELGHAFGLPHVPGHDSVMIKGNLTLVPTAADAASLAARWGACPVTSSSALPGS
jgi:predicted Zn-dependent protease